MKGYFEQNWMVL